MTRVLLTGGSGYIAPHVLDLLISHGHSVVTTVRSQSKAQMIQDACPNMPKSKLDSTIVSDIAQPYAFSQAAISNPPFEAVIHTAPFHFNIADTKNDLLDPAINGTTGILHAIMKNAPTVKLVVINSSFAAMIDAQYGNGAGKIYWEADFNLIAEDQASLKPELGYRASKTLALKAAWDFVDKEKPSFTLSVCNPLLVLDPLAHPEYLTSLDSLNTLLQRFRAILSGSCPSTGNHLFVDVRDIALAHVLCVELPAASVAGKRLFVVAGNFCNRDIVEAIAKGFQELKDRLSIGEGLKPGEYPVGGVHGFDNSRSKEVLGLKYRDLRRV
jgi:nucleoside-diphosphate-sugar epimerase